LGYETHALAIGFSPNTPPPPSLWSVKDTVSDLGSSVGGGVASKWSPYPWPPFFHAAGNNLSCVRCCLCETSSNPFGHLSLLLRAMRAPRCFLTFDVCNVGRSPLQWTIDPLSDFGMFLLSPYRVLPSSGMPAYPSSPTYPQPSWTPYSKIPVPVAPLSFFPCFTWIPHTTFPCPQGLGSDKIFPNSRGRCRPLSTLFSPVTWSPSIFGRFSLLSPSK